MRTGLATACLAVLLFGVAPRARADVADYVGRPVAEIVLETAGRPIVEARLTSLISNEVGAPLRIAEVRESITHLFSLGRFEDIRVRASARGASVVLTFELVPLQPIRSFVFRGADVPGVDAGRLRRLVVDRFGVSPRANRSADMARLVEDDLRQVGYLRAGVTARVEADGVSGHSRLRVDVTPGVRARIGTLIVTGDGAEPAAAVLQRLNLVTGDSYQRETLTGRIDRYLEDRRRRGFLTARMTMTPQPTEEDRIVNLTVNVTQGPRVRVVFSGDQIPENRRADLVPVAREASADEDLLEDSGIRIEDYLRAQGYRDAHAPFTRAQADDELVITFNVQKGPQYRVGRVEIAGNTQVTRVALDARLRVRSGQPFSVAALNADLSTIEDVYHRDGFADVQVVPETEPDQAARVGVQVPIIVRIRITENARTVVNSVSIEGIRAVPEAELSSSLGLQAGRPFFLAQLAIDRDAIQLRYANLGYPSATVMTNPGLSSDGARADVVFTVREGARLFVDHVLIVGNERTRTATIERELQFTSGDPLGLEAVNESQRRLATLGLFRRARLTQLVHGDDTRRDILVTVEEAPVTTIGYGGGIEAGQYLQRAVDGALGERLRVAPRAFFEVGRRNLFGKNRSVNFFSRMSLRPPPSESSAVTGFSEYRVIGTFREPRAFGTGADALLTGTLEQQVRSSFNFSRRAFGAELARRVTPRTSVSGNYQIQRTELFDEGIVATDRLLIDRAFPQVRLSSFSASAVRDTRDDLTDPFKGLFLSANGQIAARRIGSEVGLAKTYLTAQTFRPVPRTRRVVLAASVRLGMSSGFPRTVPKTDDFGNQEFGPGGTPLVVTVRDLPASERFFAGGDTTVRGFALDQLGAPDTIDRDGFPIGGGGLVILNAEVRVPVRGGLGVVGFIDSGNVFARTSDINLWRLRSSVGFGIRYKSPIGPIRVDVGIKARRHETAGRRESASEFHISLGQAF